MPPPSENAALEPVGEALNENLALPPGPSQPLLTGPANAPLAERNGHPPAAESPAADLSSAIRTLSAEIEKLREEQRRIQDHSSKNNSAQASSKDEKTGDAKEDGENGEDKNQQKKDQDDGRDKKDQKDQPKPPLPQRVFSWVRSHPLGTIALVAGFALLVVAGVFLWIYLQSYESTDDAEIDGHTVQVSSRVAGTVLHVNVEDTQNVTRGETLIELDPRDYQVSRSAAQANLAQATAAEQAQNPNVPITRTTQATAISVANLQVASADAAVDEAQHSYQSAQAELQQAEVQAADAATEEKRYRALVEQEEVSREQYDRRATDARSLAAMVVARQASLEAAGRAVDQRRAALDQARNRAREAAANLPQNVEIQRSQVAVRQAAVKAAQAQLLQSALNLSYIHILAPVKGIIGNRTVEVGMQIAPGQELMAITPLDDLWVTANFKENQTLNVHAGQGVTIHVDGLDRDFDGYVENLPGATGAKYSLLPPENATGNYVKVVQRLPIRIRFKPNQPAADRLRPGMSVEPKIWLK